MAGQLIPYYYWIVIIDMYIIIIFQYIFFIINCGPLLIIKLFISVTWFINVHASLNFANTADLPCKAEYFLMLFRLFLPALPFLHIRLVFSSKLQVTPTTPLFLPILLEKI